MLVKLFGAAVQGIDATIVTIEVNCSRGIKFYLVASKRIQISCTTNSSQHGSS